MCQVKSLNDLIVRFSVKLLNGKSQKKTCKRTDPDLVRCSKCWEGWDNICEEST